MPPARMAYQLCQKPMLNNKSVPSQRSSQQVRTKKDQLRSNAESIAKISVCKLHGAFPSGTAMLPCACQSPARGQGGRPDLYTAAVPGLVKHDEWNGYHTIIPMHSQPRVVLDRRIRRQQKDREGKKNLEPLFRWIHLSFSL
jgi:hypothetical protein